MGSNENVLIYATPYAKENWTRKKLFRKSVDL